MSFFIRIAGSNDFVSKIDPIAPGCWPSGEVTMVPGWDHPDILRFDTRRQADDAAQQVEDIEGFHTSVEEEKQ